MMSDEMLMKISKTIFYSILGLIAVSIIAIIGIFLLNKRNDLYVINGILVLGIDLILVLIGVNKIAGIWKPTVEAEQPPAEIKAATEPKEGE